MADIFISYAKEDERFAAVLARALGEFGYSVWWDRNIAHGTYFDREIEREIRSAQAVIIVWSENSVDSDWCRAEATVALQLRKLVPIAIQRAIPPLPFTNLQTGDFSRWKGDPEAAPFATLCKDLTGYGLHSGAVEQDDEAETHAASVLLRPTRSVSKYATAISVAAVLIIGTFAINLYWENERLHQDRDNLAVLLTKLNPPREATDQNSTDTARQRLIWPVVGDVIAGYAAKIDGRTNEGIDIAVDPGTNVKSAGDGVVAYAGNELKGYGNLILVRHSDGYVTAYAHLQDMLVHRGDTVRQGQVVAHSGSTGEVQSPRLHFEVRKGSLPVDPVTILGPMPTIAEQTIAAAQRLLTEFGYGQLKATGVMDPATIDALHRYQREHRMPLTDQITASLLADISKTLGAALK